MAVKLAPIFNDAQLDNAGLPLSGGLLTWYVAGSSTLVPTFADSEGLILQTNPIVLNVRGEPESPIWLTTGAVYKAVLTDAIGNPLRTVDNLTGINDTSAPIVSEWVLFPGTATYINTTSFSVIGDQTTVFTVGRRIQASVSGGSCYATILTSVFSTVTTITVINDSVTLDSGLSTVYYGFLDPTHSSFNVSTATYATTAGTAAACTGNSATATTLSATLAVAKGGTGVTTSTGTGSNVLSSTPTITSPVFAGTPTGVGILTSGTVVNSTSGTTIDFTGIPSWAKRITIIFNGVSTNSTTLDNMVQIGDSGGIETAGYVSVNSTVATSGTSCIDITNGFLCMRMYDPAQVFSGSLFLHKITGNTWTSNHAISRSPDYAVCVGAGIKALTATLDRVRITSTSGAATFDAGSINIMYE